MDTPLHHDRQREKAYQQALSQVRNLADAQAILYWNLLTEVQEMVVLQSPKPSGEAQAVMLHGISLKE